MIIYKKGNLVDSPDLIIARGCNAQGVMNSGVAKAIRNKWPQVYSQYRGEYTLAVLEGHKSLPLGFMFPVWIADKDGDCEKIICNCITQEFYGREVGKQYVSYSALENSLGLVANLAVHLGLESFSIPKIGAGLGGGKWDIIDAILATIVDKFDISINVWEL